MSWIRALCCLALAAPLSSAQSESGEQAGRELCAELSSGGASPADVRALLDEAGEERLDLAKAVHQCARELARTLGADPARAEECRELLLLAFDATAITENWTHRALRAYELAPYLVASGERERLRAIVEDAARRLPADHGLRSRLHGLLAQLATYRREWDLALAELRAAEAALASDPQPDVFRAQLSGLKGDVYLQMGLLDLARRWILAERDAVRALSAPDAILQAGLDVHLANLRLASEDWEALVSEVDLALARKDASSAELQTRAELLVRQGIALASLERTDPRREPRAETTLRSVLALGEAVPAHELESARSRLVELYLERGRTEEAGALLKELAAGAAEEPGSPLDAAYRAALAARWARETEQPAAQMESARAALEDAYERVHAEWSKLELRPGGIGFLATQRVRIVLCERLEGALGPLPDERARENALELLLRAESISSLARRLGSPAATVGALRRELLGPDEGLLVYLPSRWGTHVFALDRAGILHERLPPEEAYVAAQRRLNDAVRRSPAGASEDERVRRRTELEESTRLLGEALLPSSILRRLEGWGEVTLVAELLEPLPFECLGLERGEPLGLTHALGYLPSCAVGLGLVRRGRREPASLERDCLLVASPLHDPALPEEYRDLPRLPFAAEERARLLGAYPAERVAVLSGADASFERLREHVGEAAVLQVLVHGVQNPELERPAGLLLSPARSPDGASDHGLVWIERVEMLARVPDVVLATACSAGGGPERSGDPGAPDLSGAFLLRGASACVLPRGAVSYPATLELSGFLHAALKQGAGVAEALRRARVRLSEDPRYEDPYYWALLHARGLPHFVALPAPRAPESERLGVRPLVLVLAGVLVVSVLAWLVRRRALR